jgi:hypothetical protein
MGEGLFLTTIRRAGAGSTSEMGSSTLASQASLCIQLNPEPMAPSGGVPSADAPGRVRARQNAEVTLRRSHDNGIRGRHGLVRERCGQNREVRKQGFTTGGCGANARAGLRPAIGSRFADRRGEADGALIRRISKKSSSTGRRRADSRDHLIRLAVIPPEQPTPESRFTGGKPKWTTIQ